MRILRLLARLALPLTVIPLADRIPIDEENREITMAKEQLETVEGEFGLTVVEVIRQFAILLPVGVDKDDWETWWVEGWFREFCRSVSLDAVFARP